MSPGNFSGRGPQECRRARTHTRTHARAHAQISEIEQEFQADLARAADLRAELGTIIARRSPAASPMRRRRTEGDEDDRGKDEADSDQGDSNQQAAPTIQDLERQVRRVLAVLRVCQLFLHFTMP